MAAGKQPGFALLDDRIAYSWGSDEEFVLDRALSGANRLSREGSPSPAPIVGLPRRWSDNNFAIFDNGRNVQGSATAAPALLPQTPSRSHRSFLLATSRPPVIAWHPQRPTVVRGRRALRYPHVPPFQSPGNNTQTSGRPTLQCTDRLNNPGTLQLRYKAKRAACQAPKPLPPPRKRAVSEGTG